MFLVFGIWGGWNWFFKTRESSNSDFWAISEIQTANRKWAGSKFHLSTCTNLDFLFSNTLEACGKFKIVDMRKGNNTILIEKNVTRMMKYLYFSK